MYRCFSRRITIVVLLLISTAETFQPRAFFLPCPLGSLPPSFAHSRSASLSVSQFHQRKTACRPLWSAEGVGLASAEDATAVSERGTESIYYIEERLPHSATKIIAEKNAVNIMTYLEKKGIAKHNQDAFDFAMRRYAQHCEHVGRKVPIVLDSCCGTGRSTQIIAQHRPDAFVIGMDKSAPRLARTKAFREREQDSNVNMVLVRANCIDMWELIWRSELDVQEHFILYPNPYPKPTQLSRRWHGSPAFPLLLLLGGRLEVRASWRTYLQELGECTQHVLGLWGAASASASHTSDADADAELLLSEFRAPLALSPPPRPPTPTRSTVDGETAAKARDVPAGPSGEPEREGAGRPVTMSNFEGKYLEAGLCLYRLQSPLLPRRGPEHVALR